MYFGFPLSSSPFQEERLLGALAASNTQLVLGVWRLPRSLNVNKQFSAALMKRLVRWSMWNFARQIVLTFPSYLILSYTYSIWAVKLHLPENVCYILSLAEIYLVFWYPCYISPVELLETSCKSSSLPVYRKYQKGQSSDLIQNIDADGSTRFFCRIKNIKAVS